MVDQWTVNRLAGLAGEGPARAMLLAAETYSGQDAAGFGFVQRVGGVADGLDWADRIAALAPLTIAGHKVGLNEAERLDERSEAYAGAFGRAWGSADLQEGLAAFGDRRPARFNGS
jgi:enoyl-CoA hydratase